MSDTSATFRCRKCGETLGSSYLYSADGFVYHHECFPVSPKDAELADLRTILATRERELAAANERADKANTWAKEQHAAADRYAARATASERQVEAVEKAKPDRWRAKFNLWFFRDLSDEQRLKLFSIHGLPVDEIGPVHGFQRKALDLCIPTKELGK